ncbi:MAG: peptidoglycan LD-endopeptidase LytH [Thermoleophilaceae bacterium]|jgi:murein DD-endopeptidase MepM/ murein hydrolase activator NlpD|nr:peptidoglycan LD-endopeptidase LytH [Thermoleophilaceae bacterium]
MQPGHDRLHRAAAALAAVAVLGGGTAALAGSAQKSGTAASARATAYIRDDTASGKPRGFVSVSGSGSHSSSRTDASSSAKASTANYKGSASARARVEKVQMLGGMVTADTASATVTASGSATSKTARVTNLVVAGDSKGSPTKRTVYDLPGYGKLVVLDAPGHAIVALTARLSKPYGSYKAGSTLHVAYAAASASDGTRPTPVKPKPTPKPANPKKKPHGTRHPGARKPKKARRRKPSRTHALLTSNGYVFPVYGKHDYSDTWGAFRADTGFHEGNDIFANAGTPVVAVCEGSLNRVGTLPISGNRLWVKCTKAGDSFFYAHLSAFATDTRNGLQVTPGQVIGFVGSTGDAEQTPPHLHFEVHPRDGKAVDPYPFLRAWENRRDVPAAAWVRANGEVGRQPGTLVVLKDFLSR